MLLDARSGLAWQVVELVILRLACQAVALAKAGSGNPTNRVIPRLDRGIQIFLGLTFFSLFKVIF